MDKYEIGKFYATSFNGIVFEFIVFNDNTMSCPILGIDSIKRIDLKPRFVLRGSDFYYTYNAKSNSNYSSESELIGNYNIDDDLFNYLKENGMIMYSNDMAYLYGFSDTKGFDSAPGRYGVGSPYKWAKKKGPILVKQRNGQFN